MCPRSCEAPTASGFFDCGVGGGAASLPVGAPLYYDEWVDFDCRRGHVLPPAWRGRADTAAYCSGEAGVSRGLAHLRRATAGRRGTGALNFTGFNIGPGRPEAVKRPQRFPMKIHFVWGFCMGAQGA